MLNNYEAIFVKGKASNIDERSASPWMSGGTSKRINRSADGLLAIALLSRWLSGLQRSISQKGTIINDNIPADRVLGLSHEMESF